MFRGRDTVAYDRATVSTAIGSLERGSGWSLAVSFIAVVIAGPDSRDRGIDTLGPLSGDFYDITRTPYFFGSLRRC